MLLLFVGLFIVKIIGFLSVLWVLSVLVISMFILGFILIIIFVLMVSVMLFRIIKFDVMLYGFWESFSVMDLNNFFERRFLCWLKLCCLIIVEDGLLLLRRKG